MRRAEARLSASIINNSSIRCMSTGRQVGCITNTSAPRTFSWICTYTSPSLKRETRAWPRVRPRKLQTSSQSGSLAVPQKTLNLSSTRARCGLRSVFSSVIGFFSDSAVIATYLSSESFEVATVTLAEAFRVGCVPADFGVLLVDTEGLDFCVLRGLHDAFPRPSIILTEDFVETDAEKYVLLSGLGYEFAGAWGADSVWISRSHPVDTTSLRLPVSRLPAGWKPTGMPVVGQVYFESITRQCAVGWAVGEIGKLPSRDVVLDLRRRNSPQRYVFEAQRVPRVDVAQNLRTPAFWMSGFRACIDVPPGEYEVRVIQQEESSYSETVTGYVSIS